MRIGGQQIDDRIIVRIQKMIDEKPELSRVALSRQICGELKWRSRNGNLKEVSCRKALSKLGREGRTRLPESERFQGNRKRLVKPVWVDPEKVSVGTLKEFQPVELILVNKADGEISRIWNELMDRYHYLGSGPLCGAQLRYLIASIVVLGGIALVIFEKQRQR